MTLCSYMFISTFYTFNSYDCPIYSKHGRRVYEDIDERRKRRESTRRLHRDYHRRRYRRRSVVCSTRLRTELFETRRTI
ncbi:hypothetical protein NY2A_b586R [Paramecium bursaria Chlorella virus NY2A]|uniref:Uncharacterized protein b586R n=1 Tax=Paramecium bursaria Chlorella virus NY2A TaxID=46021 RepID=A7IXB1_PBCVN|nr:hypothetical protein NY2A_b586R [Paramecium bursaria Chlorella virus NY2A]ABT14985.1 hypothetical protein NY2A_b586R [Paramecium bursaria Chlorella virus NY2A]